MPTWLIGLFILLIILLFLGFVAFLVWDFLLRSSSESENISPNSPQTSAFRVTNSCSYPLWIESRATIQNPDQSFTVGAALPGYNTPNLVQPGGHFDYNVPAAGIAGTRFWAKYGCNSVGENCMIGDQMQYWPGGGCPVPNGCTPPVDSLFEATWGCQYTNADQCATNPSDTSQKLGNQTYFDTSQVDGYTLPYKVYVKGETSQCNCTGTVCNPVTLIDGSQLDLSKCPSTENLTQCATDIPQDQLPLPPPSCPYNTVTDSSVTPNITYDLNPVDLRLIVNDQIVGCMSPCKRLNYGQPYGMNQSESVAPTIFYCCPTPSSANPCTIANGCITSEICSGGPVVNTEYVNAVHQMAPGVYAYAYDDAVGLNQCPAGKVQYEMEFCPAGSPTFPVNV